MTIPIQRYFVKTRFHVNSFGKMESLSEVASEKDADRVAIYAITYARRLKSPRVRILLKFFRTLGQ